MHPPPTKPKEKNSSEIVSVKSNQPGMVTIRSLVKEKFGPSINIIIIIIRRIIIKNFRRGRMITPIFFRKYSVNIGIVENYFFGRRSLAINFLDRLIIIIILTPRGWPKW
jgi:hypothetical protein